MEGVTKTSDDVIECQDDGTWTTPNVACYCDCKVSENNVKVTNQNGLVKHNDQLQWQCATGFKKENNSAIQCFDGKLSMTPVCVPVPTVQPPPPTTSNTTTNKPDPHDRKDKQDGGVTVIVIVVIIVLLVAGSLIALLLFAKRKGKWCFKNNTKETKENAEFIRNDEKLRDETEKTYLNFSDRGAPVSQPEAV